MPTLRFNVPIQPDKTRFFMEYFQTELDGLGEQRGRGSGQPDGSYMEILECTVPIHDGTKVPISWTVTWRPDSTLQPIEVSAADDAPDEWQKVVYELIQRVLVDTLNQATQRFFRREQFAYIGPNLDGEYYISGFRLAPAIPNDEINYGSEQIVYIDQNIDAPAIHHGIALAQLRAKQIASLLSVFLGVGIYVIQPEQRWVLTRSEAGFESKRLQLGYQSITPSPASMPEKGVECPPGRPVAVDRSDPWKLEGLDQYLHCPHDVRHLFGTYNQLPLREQETYLGAACLFQIGSTVGRYYPSLRMSYEIAAVDALNIGTGRSARSFIELVQQYFPDIPAGWLSELYGRVRSAHLHEGRFPGGEFEKIDVGPFSGPAQGNRLMLSFNVHAISRSILIQWLLRRATLVETAGASQ
jgi:hypothetical protein